MSAPDSRDPSARGPNAPDPAAGDPAAGDPAAAEPDFADEHDSTTVADGLRHGPEGAAEPESPEGLGGMDQ